MNAMHDDQSENPKAPGPRQRANDEAASPGLTHNKSEGLTPGEILREGRLAHDYSIDDLSAQTKLNHRTIEALEENDFQTLSQPVFARGYYRQCAKVLDLDTDRLMAAYAAIAGDESRPRVDDRSVGAISQDVTPSGGLHFRRVLILVLFVVVVGLAIVSLLPSHGVPSALTGNTDTGNGSAATGDQVTQGGGQGGQSEAAQGTNTSGVNSANNQSPGGASGANPVSSATPKQSGAGQAAGTPDVVGDNASQSQTGQTQTGQAQTGQQPGGRNVSKTLGINTSGLSSAQGSTGNSNSNTASAASQPSVPPNRLVLKFSKRSWVRVTDANGNRMAARIFAAGDSKKFNGKPPYKITLGFAPGVKITIGGQPVDVAGHTSGGVAHLTVDAPNNGNG